MFYSLLQDGESVETGQNSLTEVDAMRAGLELQLDQMGMGSDQNKVRRVIDKGTDKEVADMFSNFSDMEVEEHEDAYEEAEDLD